MLTNFTLEELRAEFILGFLDSIIIFLFGIYFMQWYAKKKRWDESLSTAFRVSLLWLIINIPFEFFFLYFLGNSVIFVLLRITLEIVISSIVVAIYYDKEYLESLFFVFIIQIIFFVIEMIRTSFTSSILFFVGLYYIYWYSKLKRWDKPFLSSFIINITWFALNMVAVLVIFSSIGQNLFTYLLIVIVNSIIGFVILIRIYRNKWLGSLEIIGFAQITIFIASILINLLLDIVDIFLIAGNDQLDGAKFVFIIMFLFTFGLILFISNWGDKLQLVELRRVVIIVSVIPALIYLLATFVSQQVSFFQNFAQTFIISLIISIIAMVGARRIAYTTIPIHELREHHVLEKGKILLEVNNLKVYYPLFKGILKRKAGDVKAVDGVTFEIKTGETLGLVGESGCGKTTIANTILGLIEKEDGEILYHEESIPTELTSYLRQKIQMVFQDPDASLNPRLKVTDIIAEPLKNLLGITNKMEIRRNVLRLLEEVSLKREHMDRYPHEFSGGQKQRIIIARALACNPELIILDEPTSALDVSVQAQILNLLIDLQEQYGYGFLFITHNLSVVNHIADRVAVMYLGKFVELGETDQIFLNPTHPYTQALLNSHSEIDPFDQEVKYVIDGEVPSPIAPPPGCYFNPRCVSDARTPECEFELPHKIKIEEGHYIWCVNPPHGVEGIEEMDLFTGEIEEEAYKNP
jgi:peptide/nickel transport system ATP-binding protein/oligopeptide transport system ATP-binding protein